MQALGRCTSGGRATEAGATWRRCGTQSQVLVCSCAGGCTSSSLLYEIAVRPHYLSVTSLAGIGALLAPPDHLPPAG